MPLHPSVAESVLSPPVLFSESLMISSSLACFPRATVHALPSLTRPSLSLSFSLTVTKRQSCFTCRGTKESLVTVSFSPSAQSLGEREGGLCSFLPSFLSVRFSQSVSVSLAKRDSHLIRDLVRGSASLERKRGRERKPVRHPLHLITLISLVTPACYVCLSLLLSPSFALVCFSCDH